MTSTSNSPEASSDPAESAPAKEGLREKASKGAVLSLVGQGAAQVFRLIGNLVLARLLFPEAFGLMAIVYMIVFALEQFSNIGISSAILRYERGEEDSFLDTAWTIQLIRGFVLWGIGLAVTPFVADFYNQPQLREIMPVATFAAVLMGLQSTRFFLLTRRLQLGRRISIEIIARACSLVLMIGMAWVEPSIWALVLGGLMNQVVITFLSHVWIPGLRMHFAWEKRTVDEIFSLGKWVFASSGLSFVLAQMDVAMLGRLVPAGVLGVYSMGIIIPTILRDVAFQLLNSIVAPVVAQSNLEGLEPLRKRYAALRRVTLPAVALMGLGALIVIPLFFELLYDDRYADAAWIGQLALIRFWFAFLQVSGCLTLLSMGDGRPWVISNIVGLIGVTAGCLIGFELGELRGLMIGMGIGSMTSFVVPSFILWRRGVATPLPELQYTFVGAICAGSALLAIEYSAGLVPYSHSLRTLLVGGIVLSPYGLWTAMRMLREFKFR